MIKPPERSAMSSAKPSDQAQWASNTMDHLKHAQMLVRQAHQHSRDNEKNILGAKTRHHKQSGSVHSVLKKKISMTTDLIKALEDRHESVEDTIRQVGECLFQLQRAHRSKWATLNVCERRLELRDTRPIQELVRDHTQDALEHERQTLIESRQELTDHIQSCKEMLLELDKTKHEVIEDLGHKRHAQRIDRSCLSPNKHDIVHSDRVVLPHLSDVSAYNLSTDHDRGDGGLHEVSRQVDTKTLIQRAVKMEEDAMKLCNESDAVMLHTKRECQRAAQQAQTSLTRRAEETDDLKRKLEAQMREMDEAIAMTEVSLGKTKKKLEFHEMPLKTLDKQFNLRNRRTDREDIRDPVQDELEAQLEQVKKSVKTLATKFQTTKSLLDHLKESRQHLTEDYRSKLLALKIEDACLKVTPRKAIEMNRTDPRGGRCKVPSSKRSARKEGGGAAMPPMQADSFGDQATNLGSSTGTSDLLQSFSWVH
jgi:chromosome segregation ATPase